MDAIYNKFKNSTSLTYFQNRLLLSVKLFHHIANKEYEQVDSFIKKNLEAIFVGLEALGLADRNTFYNRSDMSFRKEESKWLVKEFSKLNREKFTKYLKKHLKNN
jgi:hypothetical protein